MNRSVIRAKDQKYRKENADTLRKRDRQRYEKRREQQREYHRQYYQENKEECARRNREYHLANYEQIKAAAKRWQKANPDKKRNYQRQRRAWKLGAESERYCEGDINAMWHEQDGVCSYCEIPLFGDYHVDHVIPLSRGGSDRLDNLVLACPSCNRWKSTKTGEQFRKILAAENKNRS